MISRVRTIPDGQNPEDVMRDLIGDRKVCWLNYQEVMDYLYTTMEADPEIQGIIGYSEGAAIAAALILDEERRFQKTGRPRQVKCAMFVTGWPPSHPEEGVLLADESDRVLDVPTLHVVGANGKPLSSFMSMPLRLIEFFCIDPFRHGAFALYNVCDQDTAVFFDTGKGHTIPRSGLVIHELADAIRNLKDKALNPDDF